MKMLKILLLISMLTIASCKTLPKDEPAGDEWLKPADNESLYGKGTTDIDKTDFFEVSATKEDIAKMYLYDKDFIKLSCNEAKWYTGHYYTCPEGKVPYLVRAVYGHGGTGGYTLKRNGENLIVTHGSLGRFTTYNKSALIVNLDFTPKDVFIVVHIAE